MSASPAVMVGLVFYIELMNRKDKSDALISQGTKMVFLLLF